MVMRHSVSCSFFTYVIRKCLLVDMTQVIIRHLGTILHDRLYFQNMFYILKMSEKMISHTLLFLTPFSIMLHRYECRFCSVMFKVWMWSL